jgi:hypothetical protein
MKTCGTCILAHVPGWEMFSQEISGIHQFHCLQQLRISVIMIHYVCISIDMAIGTSPLV